MKSRKLIAGLIVVVVAAGVYWMIQRSPESKPVADASDPNAPTVVAEGTENAPPLAENEDLSAPQVPPGEYDPMAQEDALPAAQSAAMAGNPLSQNEMTDDDFAFDVEPFGEDGETPMTGQELIDFSQHLTGLMDHAITSEKEAVPAFAQLEQCIRETQSAAMSQARLICYSNASKLSQKYPGALADKFKALSEGNPNLVGQLQTSGMDQ